MSRAGRMLWVLTMWVDGSCNCEVYVFEDQDDAIMSFEQALLDNGADDEDTERLTQMPTFKPDQKITWNDEEGTCVQLQCVVTQKDMVNTPGGR